ncbi:cytochrome b/b6 domain-containing protein [Kaarinaea lacus]
MVNENQVKVWDIAIRIFHWSLVLSFSVAYLTGEEDSQLHNWLGYVVLGLVAFRLIWGIIGTRYGRFWNFIYSPTNTIAYARSLLSGHPKHYLGHNPLGGWMVIMLLLFILLTSWTGLEIEAAEGRGPLAMEMSIIQPAYADKDRDHREKDREEDSEGDEFWEELHEFFANVTLFLVFLHIGGVVFSSAIHRENLVKAMITGYKQLKTE